MVYFRTKNPSLGKFWRALDWKMLSMYFMAILNILRTFGIFNDHLVHFVFIWYIFSGFGIMNNEKSGNSVESGSQNDFKFKFRLCYVLQVQNLPISFFN
jgi:hypothetical protein